MAWLRCPNSSPVPPMPVGQTFTNSYSKSAPVNTNQLDVKATKILDTRNVVSLTIRVDYQVRAYASGSSGSWESATENQSSFYFKVNGNSYLSTSKTVWSYNDGWKSESGTATYTITGFPRGDCEFNYDMKVYYYQNGGQLDPSAQSSISFTITNVTYKS